MSQEITNNKHVYEISGYDLQKMKVSLDGNCGILHLPKSWVGKNVVVILLDKPEEE